MNILVGDVVAASFAVAAAWPSAAAVVAVAPALVATTTAITLPLNLPYLSTALHLEKSGEKMRRFLEIMEDHLALVFRLRVAQSLQDHLQLWLRRVYPAAIARRNVQGRLCHRHCWATGHRCRHKHQCQATSSL